MKKFINSRVLPFVCVLSILVSLMIPVASAAGVGIDENLDTNSVSAWQSAVGNDVTDFVDKFAGFLDVPLTNSAVFWRIMDGTLGSHLGEMDRDTLELVCTRLNNAFGSIPIDKQFSGLPDTMRTWFGMTLNDLMGFGTMHFEVQYPSGTAGYYRIVESVSGIPVVNSRGMYPCTLHESVSSDDITPSGCKFVPISHLNGKVNMMPYESLYNLGQDYDLTPMKYDKYWILKKPGFGVTDFVLADADGYPCVARYEEDKWASEQDRPTDKVTENGDIIEGDLIDNSVNLDLEGMTITLPDGSINFIDKIIYDESTKSYHIDSHDTYNYTTNNYYTWNYYINYTSITYIGQTEEYNKYYEVYYELPDGRSSADLTKEDLEQLNLSVDVIPYGRSADDTSLRSLYHFDGDTKDSSYWNYCTDFTWNKGASLTYMDAGVFDGALYLDELEHQFTFTLPSNIGSSDFTLQFRYYQSATAAPVTDSSVKIGDGVIFQMDGSSFKTASGTAIAPISIGNWQEVCLMRSGGALRLYHNGLPIFTYPVHANYTGSLGDTITFTFGSEQQTFKYFDEFRFVNKAVYDADSYDPSSVPHDTNLTLVLPDSKLPVADEYWSIKNDEQTNLLSHYNMDAFYGSSNATNSYFRGSSSTLIASQFTSSSGALQSLGYFAEGGDSMGTGMVDPSFPAFAYYRNHTDVEFLDDGIHMDSSNWPENLPLDKIIYYKAGLSNSLLTANYFYSVVPASGLYSCLTCDYGKGQQVNNLASGEYTFTLVTSSGAKESVTFFVPSTFDSSYNHSVTSEIVEAYNSSGPVSMSTVGGYEFGLYKTYATITGSLLQPYYWLVIRPVSRTTVTEGIVYMELVEGSETALEAEWVESVTAIDKANLNTPTLAVRTDIDITSYQIGGPRPSVPAKGQVWAMIENERIVSLQIYNGQAWEGVDGRIWTGERWIPMSSYNIITLQDLYDIVDATPNYEYIYSEAGFWAWWQKSWNAFTEKLFSLLSAGGASGGGVSITPETAPAVPDDEVTGEKGYNAIELFVVLKDGTWNFITGIVGMAFDGFNGFVESVSSAGNFFTVYDEDSENSIVFIPLEEGETIWD